MVFFILLNYGDFLLTKIGCFRLTLFGDFHRSLTKYRIYDWDGNLVDEIIPSETLGASDGAFPIAYHEMDYSSIVRVWNGQLIAYHFIESEIELLSCNLETHACEFLKS